MVKRGSDLEDERVLLYHREACITSCVHLRKDSDVEENGFFLIIVVCIIFCGGKKGRISCSLLHSLSLTWKTRCGRRHRKNKTGSGNRGMAFSFLLDMNKKDTNAAVKH